ncbi:MAG: FecR family protein [Acinetobacter sp.]
MTRLDPSQEDQLSRHMVQAIDWMLKLDSGLATTQDHLDFNTWLNADALNAQAWQQLQQTTDLPFQHIHEQRLDTNVPVQLVTQTILKNKKSKVNKRFMQGSALLFLCSLAVIVWLQQSRPLSFWQADYFTKTAEQKTIFLEDGSRITLDAYTAIRVDYTQHVRHVYVLQGSIIADVAANKNRPFIVHTEYADMQALGTKFMVHQAEKYSELAVLQHRVRADNHKQRVTVKETQAIQIDHNQIQPLPESAVIRSSWQTGILETQEMPLGDLIARIGAYRQGYIYVSERVAKLPIYGVFYLKDTDKILETLAATQPIQVTRIGSQFVYIDAKK